MIDLGDRDILARRAQWAAGAALTVLILYFHFVFMNHAGGFWRDEVNSIQIAAMPTLSELWAAMRFDSFPVLFSLVVRFWASIGLGGGDAGFRLLGLLIGSSIVAAAWYNARLIGRSVPLIFLTLFAFSSLAIRYGDSIRPYGLGIFFILLALGLVWTVAESPSPLKAAAAAAAVVLSVQCLYTNAILVFAICLGGIAVALYNGFWKRAALVAGIGAAGALSLLPYMDLMKNSSDWVALVQYSSTFKESWEVLSRQSLGYASSLVLWLWCALFSLGVILAIYRVFSGDDSAASKKERDMAVFFATAMVVSLAGFFIFVKLVKVFPKPWYFLSPMAVAAVSFDALFGGCRRLWGLCRVALAVLVAALTLNTVRHGVQVRQTNVDLIAEKLGRIAEKDDLILLAPWHIGITFERYYKGETPWMTIPPMEYLTIVRYDLLKKKMVSTDTIRPVLDSIDNTLGRGKRLWLVGDFYINNSPEAYAKFRPKPGRLPFVMPPPPAGPYGWNNGPYLQSWLMQTEYFIYSKAVPWKRLPLDGGKDVSRYERSYIIEVEGKRLPAHGPESIFR